jgi:hypothetical protein
MTVGCGGPLWFVEFLRLGTEGKWTTRSRQPAACTTARTGKQNEIWTMALGKLCCIYVQYLVAIHLSLSQCVLLRLISLLLGISFTLRFTGLEW